MSSPPGFTWSRLASNATVPVLTPLNIAPTMDGVYWGILVSTMLSGITISQAWTYVNDNRDTWALRSFVAILIVMDFTATGLNWQALRFYLMTNFGDSSNLLTITKPWAASMILIEIIAAVAECFFASRIYLINKKSLWAPILACLFAISGSVCITVAIHSNFQDPHVNQLNSRFEKIVLGTGLSCTLCAVLLITVVLVIRLSKVRSTGVKNTHSTVQRLLLFFVTRGLLVTITEVAFLAVYEANSPTSMHWVPFLLLDPKVHIITMMGMLNARHPPTRDAMMMSIAIPRDSEAMEFGPQRKSRNSSPRGKAILPVVHISSVTDRADI